MHSLCGQRTSTTKNNFFVELVQFKEFLDQTEELKAQVVRPNSSTKPNQMEPNQEICSPNQLQGRLEIDSNRHGHLPVHLPSFEEIAKSNPAMEQEWDLKTPCGA